MPDFPENPQFARFKQSERLVNGLSDDQSQTDVQSKGVVRETKYSQAVIGSVIADRFVLLEFIASGGMGSVFKAEQLATSRIVAIKLLSQQAIADEDRQRFHREARIASSLNHANAVTIYDFGETATGQLFIAMEYVEGRDLAAELDRNETLSVPAVLDIGKQICDVLAQAHGARIVHRDLKPSNIMLVERKSLSPLVKILDFGIAKSDQENMALTRTGQVFGSPLYMSPEQCSGAKVTKAADIYSLGCILYELLVGVPPHRGNSAFATMLMHSEEEASSFKKVRPDLKIPASLESVVFKCLEKAPSSRYASAAELRADLCNIEQGIKIAPRRSSSAKFKRGHIIAGLVSLAVLVLLASVLCLVVLKPGQSVIKGDEHNTEAAAPGSNSPTVAATTPASRAASGAALVPSAELSLKQPSLSSSSSSNSTSDAVLEGLIDNGARCYSLRKFDLALPFYRAAYKRARKTGNDEAILQIDNNYAIALEINGRSYDAIEPLKYLLKLKDSRHLGGQSLAETLEHLYRYLYDNKHPVEGDKIALRALNFDKQVRPDSWLTGNDYMAIGNSQMSQGNADLAKGRTQEAKKKLDAAKKYFEAAQLWLDTHPQTRETRRFEGLNKYYQSDLADVQHNYQEALTFRLAAIERLKDSDPNLIPDMYFHNANDWQNLHEYQKQRQSLELAIRATDKAVDSDILVEKYQAQLKGMRPSTIR